MFKICFIKLLTRSLEGQTYNTNRFVFQRSMRILNVAEKNDAAKNIAFFLSDGRATTREGLSKFNKIYEFECKVFGQNCKMIMTSVCGHLLNYQFVNACKSWKISNPSSLFDEPIHKICIPENENIQKTLTREIKSCSRLIIWTDCDREGEGIGFEIIEVCKEVKSNIEVYRAKFSEITHQSVKKALISLETPNKHWNDAVNVRQELDLRIGAAFTRFQTIHLAEAFPNIFGNKTLVSYGSCQFPTLGFVVERFKAISEFIPENFWQINVNHTIGDLSVEFHWKRNRLFDKLACEVLYDKCKEAGRATVENVECKPKIKFRPRPLDTVELEKLASKKLKITAKQTLRIAEKLYTQGLISYPRTETNIFSKELNLIPLIQLQTEDPSWGKFAKKILKDGPNPFQGKKSDEAHPPIHPIKYTDTLYGNEKVIYDFIVRHFLACLSKHAEGMETTVDISIADEKFVAKGLTITAKNYLEVYPYEKWDDKEIHAYKKGDDFKPEIKMFEGKTSPPEFLTEADLISLMEKHGIGTDATHAEHIETIKSRLYVGLKNKKYFVPRTLGMGLIEGYINMGHLEMTKPNLRAELEIDLKRICDNKESPEAVLARHIKNYKEVYESVQQRINHLYETMQNYTKLEAVPVQPDKVFNSVSKPVMKCPVCNSDLLLRKKDHKIFVTCSAFPQCRHAIWFPSFVLDATVTNDTCNKCGPNNYLIQFKFDGKSCYLPPNYIGCVGGCDTILIEALQCNSRMKYVEPTAQSVEMISNDINDSGFGSLNESPISANTFQESTVPNCLCGKPCIRLIDRKPGPNCGKAFYKCQNPEKFSNCGFFQWEKEDNNSNSRRRKLTQINCKENAYINSNSNKEEIRCYCALISFRSTVKKEGPNKGRNFYSCGKPLNDKDRCNFFKWADNKENLFQNNEGDFHNHVNRTKDNGDKSSDRNNATESKRKCGICKKKGHNRKKCAEK